MSKVKTATQAYLEDQNFNFGGSNTAHADMGIANLDAYNQHIIGRILTLIDATMDVTSRTIALKKLIKQDVWQARDAVWRWMSRQDEENADNFPFIKETI